MPRIVTLTFWVFICQFDSYHPGSPLRILHDRGGPHHIRPGNIQPDPLARGHVFGREITQTTSMRIWRPGDDNRLYLLSDSIFCLSVYKTATDNGELHE